MELDELKQKWTEHDRKLDLSIRLNRRLMRDTYTRRAKFALWRLAAMLALGSLFMLVVIVFLGAFTAKNWAMPKFTIPAILLDIAAIAALAALNAQIGMALKMDYDQPVAAIQKRLETLRKFRIRYIQAILVSAALLWMPLFIVAMKGFFDADVYRLFATSWIVTNVAFGFAVLALGIWLSKKYRPDAGYNLNAASGFLATLAEFEEDHSPHDRSSIRAYSPDE
jgi:MFS family permease